MDEKKVFKYGDFGEVFKECPGRRASCRDVAVYPKQREAMQQVRARDEEERIVSSRHSEVNLQIRRVVHGESREEAKTVHRGLSVAN